jgi:hypothetical protein
MTKRYQVREATKQITHAYAHPMKIRRALKENRSRQQAATE